MAHAVSITRAGDTQPIRPEAVVLLDPSTGQPMACAVQGLGIPAHTNITLAYTGGNLTTVVYKNGATTVATVTLAYDASNNITSVTKV